MTGSAAGSCFWNQSLSLLFVAPLYPLRRIIVYCCSPGQAVPVPMDVTGPEGDGHGRNGIVSPELYPAVVIKASGKNG
jgi:hypothetical protein